MQPENKKERNSTLKLPNRLFVFSIMVGLFTPFIARLPSVPFRGAEWLTAYFAGGIGILFFSAFNLIPSFAWYGLGRASRKFPIAYWFSISGGMAFLLYAHGSINLSSSSTAAIGLVFIPFYAVGAILVSWGFGCIINFIIKPERFRLWTAWSIGILAIMCGIVTPVQQSRSIVARESRFPYTAVSSIPLQKKLIYGRDSIGRVSVLSYDKFGQSTEKVIAVLSHSNITVMKPGTYNVIAKSDYNQEDCDGCVHMYPYLVPDGKGSILVSTSDGVSDKNGKLRWIWKAEGFSRVVPIQASTPTPSFFTYKLLDRVVLHNAEGKELWRNEIQVSNIGLYETADGQQLPFAMTNCKKSRALTIYNLNSKLYKTIQLPEWASNVAAIAWPSRGHLLVGYGSHLGVIDPNGKIVLEYVIQNTSFAPYHGPDGTAVKFGSSEEPYLAVLSHGSSGYARSVLLIFNPKGNLVWQEELSKLSTIIAVPNQDSMSEVLLVGGRDGIIEYRLSK